MKARYHQRGDAVDIVPATDLEAGEIVRLNNLIGVTRLPVKAGELGTVAISGIFEIAKPPGMEFHTGNNVCWNSESRSVSPEGILLGIAVREAKPAQSSVYVLLNSARGVSEAGADDEWHTL